MLFQATRTGLLVATLATGQKTYNNAISVDHCGRPLETIAHVAKQSGRMAGIVTSVQFNHATPAVFGANHTSRNAYAEIGNLMLAGGMADLIMGAGHPEFDSNGVAHTTANHRYISETDWNMLKQGAMFPAGSTKPWILIETKEQFERLAVFGKSA